MPQIGTRFGDICAHAGAHFDLARQKLWRDLIAQRLHAILHQSIGHIGKGAGLGVDQQVFFFNAKRILWRFHRVMLPRKSPLRKKMLWRHAIWHDSDTA